MLAVDIGISHQHDLVVAQTVDIEFILHTGAEGRHQCLHLGVSQHLVDTRLFDVEDLSANREDRLALGVAPLTCGTACGVALDNEDLAVLGLTARAVDELAGHASAAE